ncbi:MAG: flagellar biosynthetic protein FliO [Nitriliruptoraceae bacterium]|nr:flagellar biosynthetic protein FliO [Nitriliruptoraceae bacterium]
MIESSAGALLLLAALVAVPLLLRRHRASTPDGVRVVGRTALHKNAVVAIVAVGDRRLLVGAGERGVQLLTELDPAGAPPATVADALDLSTTSTDLAATLAVPSSFDRMDAAGHLAASTSPNTSEVLAGLERTRSTAGPRTGLVDRLRGMTVRTPVQGRPFHVVLRR